ncbi:MAG: glutamate synthase subunit alpha, partial [Candidatus Methanomethylophilaceae archaeon]|nr:glutamate synthase subunit alpha [Candidatus Methanomethylophilaceae archaeon]
FDVSEGPDGLEKALEEICRKADEIVDEGESYIILSDRGVDAKHAPIPSLLAVSAVHQHLVDNKKRLQTGIIVESGEPREVEHIALLFAYGVNLVNPYLLYRQIEELCESGSIPYDADTAESRYIHVLEKGLMKVMSKMGISTIRSYRGSCLFEAIGLDKELCQRYMFGTTSSLGGIGLGEIAEDIIANHSAAFGSDLYELIDRGIYNHHTGGERHAWSPEVVKLLHASAADPDIYPAFAERADLGDGLFFIRDLMEEKKSGRLTTEDVEPASEIVKRFVIEAKSFGAISKEAHETAASAANTIHAKSNCGEGGEDPARNLMLDGRDIRSRVRQVASGRFGVNTEYLVNADEIQIKCAQGAKPGEGGQLMGFKVDKVIASTRHTLPGVTLISPPPHHDIYSIEDLKQLILDLRCVNPKACISVKLVSEAGVGTVAAGVAKAGADKILISGADGGTGAAPMSSMRYAGLPWEIGLAEAQQSLVSNGFRGRVILQVDGQLKTGRDVIIAALLGADEFGFATSILVSMGCVVCRKCQTNTCPVGIATQDPERRARFKGTPEHVINYLSSVAEDVRSRLASMGFRRLSDIIGRADLISKRKVFGRASSIDISPLLYTEEGDRSFRGSDIVRQAGSIDRDIIDSCISSIEAGNEINLTYTIRNTDRSVGAMLSGEMQRRGLLLRNDTVNIRFTGDAGQSFGAFLSKGVTFHLDGQANDFVGKGLSGGRISISREDSNSTDVLAGNTVLYGATAGELYIAGCVGERFCVRNSGAIAVAEGAGDHCCEYMTGGRVVVLGRCGRNFAAGMSAGIAYVLNDDGDFDRHCNMDMVELELVDDPEDRK